MGGTVPGNCIAARWVIPANQHQLLTSDVNLHLYPPPSDTSLSAINWVRVESSIAIEGMNKLNVKGHVGWASISSTFSTQSYLRQGKRRSKGEKHLICQENEYLKLSNTKITSLRIKLSCPYCRQTHSKLSYHGQHKGASFYETYEVTAKKVENKIVYYKKQWSVCT
jgi:hypothetical protein